MNNLYGILLCFGYIFMTIGLAEGLRRWHGYSHNFTRKFIHIGVGMMSWFIHYLFDSPWPFALACTLFMFINLLDWKYVFFAAMASSDRSNLGTVYFPLAAAVVAILFWPKAPLMVAALMPLTWGDGLAPVIGKAYGRHPYTISGHTRTLEGSLGFVVAAFFFSWLALWLIPSPIFFLTPTQAILPALALASTTAVAEAVSLWGLDNLTITAVASVILTLWPF